MNLRYILSLSLILILNNSIGQNLIANERISEKEFTEIIELYKEGQFQVIKSKLKNKGFDLVNEVPEYALKNENFSGEFEFEKEILFAKQFGNEFNLNSSFKFKTIKHSDSATEYSIEFIFYSRESKVTFYSIKRNWENTGEYNEYEFDCFNQDCFRVGMIQKQHHETEIGFTPSFNWNTYFSPWEISYSPKPVEGEERVHYNLGENYEIELLEVNLSENSKNNFDSFSGSYYYRKLHNKIEDVDEWLSKNILPN
ncbi:MAG: hypothetical protein GYB55_19340 [Cytophagales bacterium]|nr:hypothetical protein [Cytophagales bacterium]